MLKIAFYEGEYGGDLSALTHLCDVAGEAVTHESVLYQVVDVLEQCVDRHSAPVPVGDCFTVFVGHISGSSEGQPLARLDVHAHDGDALASISSEEPRWSTERVCYLPTDDVVTILHKILAGNIDDYRT